LKFDKPYSGSCTIGCSGAIAQRIYPALIALQSQYSQLNVKLEVSPQQTILSNVENGELDLGIVTNQPDLTLFTAKYLGEESLSLFLPNAVTPKLNIADTLRNLGVIDHPDANCLLHTSPSPRDS